MISRHDLLERVASGEQWMRSYAARAERAFRRYKDPSGVSSPPRFPEGGAQDQPLGDINYAAINVRQKIAALALTAPEFLVTAADAAASDLVRTHLRDTWHRDNRIRLLRRVLLCRTIVGMGFLAYLWDREHGFLAEYVHVRDVIYDPHTYDETWDTPRWAGRKVRVPQAEAIERWGSVIGEHLRERDADDKATAVEITLYWDSEIEAEILGSKILRTAPNAYGRVPILVLQGDPHPVSEFADGDYDQCVGAIDLYHRLQNILNNAALHGGGTGWLRSDFVDESVRQAVLEGTHRGWVPINGVPGEQAIGYTPAMPIAPAVLEAMRFVGAGLDADQGVPQYARGVTLRDPKFATQVAMETSASGARATLGRAEFERFAERVARAEIECHAKFGLGGASWPTDEEIALFEAMSSVTDIRVSEESASYRDPAMEQQASLQMLQTVAGLMPLFLQLGQAGVVDRIPNITAYLTDVLHAYRRRETDAYWRPIETQLAAAPTTEETSGTTQRSNDAG